VCKYKDFKECSGLGREPLISARQSSRAKAHPSISPCQSWVHRLAAWELHASGQAPRDPRGLPFGQRRDRAGGLEKLNDMPTRVAGVRDLPVQARQRETALDSASTRKALTLGFFFHARKSATLRNTQYATRFTHHVSCPLRRRVSRD
jgi:hypothetical protein